MAVAAALGAAQAGTLGFGFSGAGFLIPFFLGVIEVLQLQLGVMQPTMPMAGGSSGALVTLTANGLVPLAAMRAEAAQMSDYCLKRGNCYGILQSTVAAAAERLLPLDAAERANSAGNTHLAVVYPEPLGRKPAEQQLVSSFANRSDLIEAVKTSIYIPLFAGPSLTREFRGRPAYDGAFAGPGQGFLPCPPNVTYCVRISSMPAGLRLFSILTNDLLLGEADNKRRAVDVAANILLGSDLANTLSATIRSLTGNARADVPGEAAQIKQMVGQLMRLFTPGEDGADIWPGRRHPLPVTELFWSTWMMSPPTIDWADKIFELGKAEALSWAKEAGFANSQGQRQQQRQQQESGPGPHKASPGSAAAAAKGGLAGTGLRSKTARSAEASIKFGVQEGRRLH